MSELKTLKDFGCLRDEFSNLDFTICSKDELKAEAVKWVKYYENWKIDDKPLFDNWIKHFFNLIEEDLK